MRNEFFNHHHETRFSAIANAYSFRLRCAAVRAPFLLAVSRPLLTAVLIALLTALPTALLTACSTAQYRGREGYDASCPTQIEYPCTVQASGALGPAACEGDPSKLTGLAQQIPGDASYPPGCTIIVPVPLADDNGQCIVAGSCRCTSSADAGKNYLEDGGGANLEWICFKSHY